MYAKKKKKLILAALLGIIVLVLVGGIFWIGKKLGEKNTSQVKNNQKIELESQLQQLKSQIHKETNSIKKQELETKKVNLEQQLNQLRNQNNPSSPSSPSPNSNNPNNNSPPQQTPPPKNSRKFTVKCNGAVGGKCEYINVANPQERILIDVKNKVFYSDDVLYMKGNQYNISFYEEDAEKKGNNFIFEEDNDKFQLTPTTSPNPNPNNNPNQVEIEVKWGGGSGKKNYWMFLTPNTLPEDRKKIFISKKNPVVTGKKFAHGITPVLKISFAEKDASQKLEDNEWLFDENNQKLTITPLANWPDDPNYQDQIEEEKPKTVKSLRSGGVRDDYIGFDNLPPGGSIAANLFENYWVHVDHPEIKRLGLGAALGKNRKALDGKKWVISFEYVDKIEHNSHFYFNRNNNSLEIKKES